MKGEKLALSGVTYFGIGTSLLSSLHLYEFSLFSVSVLSHV